MADTNFRLFLNDVRLASGDETLRMIFRNLMGQNKLEGGYAGYLDDMRKFLGLDDLAGQLKLCDSEGHLLMEATVPEVEDVARQWADYRAHCLGYRSYGHIQAVGKPSDIAAADAEWRLHVGNPESISQVAMGMG